MKKLVSEKVVHAIIVCLEIMEGVVWGKDIGMQVYILAKCDNVVVTSVSNKTSRVTVTESIKELELIGID